jgi:hypothetical protein
LSNADEPAVAAEAGQQTAEQTVAPEQVYDPWLDPDATMPLPMLRARQRAALGLSLMTSAADMTAPLPAFGDSVAFRRPPVEAARVPVPDESASEAGHGPYSVDNGASLLADQDTIVGLTAVRRRRPERPQVADNSHAGPLGWTDNGHDD